MRFSIMDDQIFEAVNKSEEKIQSKLDCNVLNFYGPIVPQISPYFRNYIEALVQETGKHKKEALGIVLTTPGGSAETVEDLVEIIRHHFSVLYFIVPHKAMSAGTIFCMSGDKIYMDYSSSLGPIDPQVPDREGKLVPALGYLDKVNDFINRSQQGSLSPAEFIMLKELDLATLRRYEQARDLSVDLLKRWLVQYKFKNWTTHRTTNPGAPVTEQEKVNRASEIARLLSDNNMWHSHGRHIKMNILRQALKLEIDDYGADKDLQRHIRIYSDTLTNYFERQGIQFELHSRFVL